MIGQAVWLAIAAFDACLLAYLAVSYRWLAWHVPDAPTPAALIVYALVYGVIALLTLFVAAVVVAIGAGIVRQFRPDFARSRWIAGVAATILAVTLLAVAFDWVRLVWPIAAVRDAARVDRLGVFEGEQVGRAQHHPLAQRGLRPALEGRRARDGSGQAGRAVHPDERPADPARRRHPDPLAQHRVGDLPPAQGDRHLDLELQLLEPRQLVPAARVAVTAGLGG
jgi:hypothetical protein